MTLSLRTQLFLWLVLAGILIAFGVTFLSEQVTVWNMEQSLDDSLKKKAHLVAAIISSDITTDEASYVQVMSELANQKLPFIPLLLRIVSPSGKIIIEFGNIASPNIEKLNYPLQLPDISKGRFDSIMMGDADPLRAYSVSVSDPRTYQTLAFVQILESMGQIEETKRQLWKNGIIVGFSGSVLAMVVGLFVIRRAFRPLRSILQAVDNVDYTHLKTHLQQETRPAELEQLAKSLTAMWRRLDVAVNEKQKLIGGVSHDLRTPLTALQGQLEVLLLQTELTPDTRDILERVLKETRRLIRLVRNLLLSAQLESKPTLTTTEVNLRELLDEVVGDMWTLVEGLQFSFVVPRDISIYGDRDLLKQMLINIIHNAVKFTPKGGKVGFKLTGDDEWAILEISDTGQGIAVDDLPHVTEAFYKPASSRISASQGSGLGLSIVKQIVELHSGKLEIQSQERLGTSVTVRLPKRVLIVLPEQKQGNS